MIPAISTALVTAAILAVGVMAGSCQNGGDTTTSGSGIEGLVTIGPMCPVEREDTPCPDQPYQATIDALNADGDKVMTFESGEDGRFRVAIEPGRYTLEPQSPNGASLPYASPVDVEVHAGAYTHIDIQYDSGIR